MTILCMFIKIISDLARCINNKFDIKISHHSIVHFYPGFE